MRRSPRISERSRRTLDERLSLRFPSLTAVSFAPAWQAPRPARVSAKRRYREASGSRPRPTTEVGSFGRWARLGWNQRPLAREVNDRCCGLLPCAAISRRDRASPLLATAICCRLLRSVASRALPRTGYSRAMSRKNVEPSRHPTDKLPVLPHTRTSVGRTGRRWKDGGVSGDQTPQRRRQLESAKSMGTLACLLVGISLFAPPAAEAQGPVASHAQLYTTSTPYALKERIFAESKAMGASFIRLDVQMAPIFERDGVPLAEPDWRGLDEVMGLSSAYALPVLGIVRQTPRSISTCPDLQSVGECAAKDPKRLLPARGPDRRARGRGDPSLGDRQRA